MPINALNHIDAQALADHHEDQLTAAYEDVLRAAGRKAAARFRRLSPLTAAGEPPPDPKQPNWAPPNIDELVDLKQIGAQTARQTRSIRLEALAAVLGAYGETIAQVSGVQVGEPAFDVTNPAALTLLDGTAGRAGDVAKSVRDDLQKTIGLGYQEGWSVNRTAAQIIEISDQFSKAQARMLARTDLNGIANGGSVIAAKEVGVNYKTWLTASDDLVRPTHQDADGQTVPIDEPFDVGGEALDYPGDPGGSDAECCNCRCVVEYSDQLGGGEAAGDEMAASAIIEGGAMPEAQITIPLTLTVGAPNTNAGGRTTWEMVTPDEVAEIVDVTAAAPPPAWRAVLCAEGEPTEDGRLLAPGSITWRALPLTLLCQVETAAGHDGAEVCGRIDRIWREGSQIMAEGVFDSGEFGVEAARLVRDETLRGVSVDLAVLDYELRPAEPPEGEALDIGDIPEVAEPEVFVVLDGVIGAATICAFQAIAQATIEVLTAAGPIRLARVTTPQTSEALAASAVEAEAPLCPPAAWFDDPALEQPTLVTVSDDGRVFGHVAPWRGCHTGYAGRCVSPPRSRSGYAAFHTGRIETAEGDLLPIGKLTLASGHAALDLNDAAARAHYDNSSRVVAFVRAGEDEHGIWVAGALRPGVAPAMIQDLLANPLSGDWRNGELVAAHAVPVPGFPILQASAIGEDGEEATALILTSTIGLAASGAEEPDPGPRLRVLAARARGGVEALAELARE